MKRKIFPIEEFYLSDFFQACFVADVEDVQRWIEAGASVTRPHPADHSTPLHITARGLLIGTGTDSAYETKYQQVIELLLSKGADPVALDKKGQRPEDVAVSWGQPALGEFIRSIYQAERIRTALAPVMTKKKTNRL